MKVQKRLKGTKIKVWSSYRPETITVNKNLINYQVKKKNATVRDRAMASQRNLHTKGGVPSAGRRGAFINKLFGNSKCHAPLCKQK